MLKFNTSTVKPESKYLYLQFVFIFSFKRSLNKHILCIYKRDEKFFRLLLAKTSLTYKDVFSRKSQITSKIWIKICEYAKSNT